tara:strand:+ start:7854 stop:8615 length:762 start_codon:yes stop_codon:yes gene_type:complete
MILSDSTFPNKYDFLKELIVPYSTDFTKKRYGNNWDGGYIYLKELFDESSIVYSYGIDDNPSAIYFDIHCANEGKKVYMYDGTIEGCPVNNQNFFFKKENLYKGVLENQIKENSHDKETNMVLKMDIEGSEYEVINSDIELISKHFNQMNIEVHSLIEEDSDNSGLDELSCAIKKDNKIKKVFFEKLLEYYNIVHIHANNYTPRYGDFPETMELTLLRKNYSFNGIDKTKFPIKGLDFPNNPNEQDYDLDWWI